MVEVEVEERGVVEEHGVVEVEERGVVVVEVEKRAVVEVEEHGVTRRRLRKRDGTREGERRR